MVTAPLLSCFVEALAAKGKSNARCLGAGKEAFERYRPGIAVGPQSFHGKQLAEFLDAVLDPLFTVVITFSQQKGVRSWKLRGTRESRKHRQAESGQRSWRTS